MFTKPNRIFFIKTHSKDAPREANLHAWCTEDYEEVAKLFFDEELFEIQVHLGSYIWTYQRQHGSDGWMKGDPRNFIYADTEGWDF